MVLQCETWYVDTCLPFKYHDGSVLFQCLSYTMCIMGQTNFDDINYIKDILGIDIPEFEISVKSQYHPPHQGTF